MLFSLLIFIIYSFILLFMFTCVRAFVLNIPSWHIGFALQIRQCGTFLTFISPSLLGRDRPQTTRRGRTPPLPRILFFTPLPPPPPLPIFSSLPEPWRATSPSRRCGQKREMSRERSLFLLSAAAPSTPPKKPPAPSVCPAL